MFKAQNLPARDLYLLKEALLIYVDIVAKKQVTYHLPYHIDIRAVLKSNKYICVKDRGHPHQGVLLNDVNGKIKKINVKI